MLGVPVPFHRNFDEVNPRFYVRRRAEDGWRRGVVFVRELVPRPAIALVARWTYNEPYTAVPMRHDLDIAGAADGLAGRATYEWRLAGRWHRLEVRTAGRPAPPDPDSEAAFLAERGWGYSVQRDGGDGFAECLTPLPRSAFLAEGSAVQVYEGRRLPAAQIGWQEELSGR